MPDFLAGTGAASRETLGVFVRLVIAMLLGAVVAVVYRRTRYTTPMTPTFTVTLVLEAPHLNTAGMVRNLHDLAPFKTYLDGSFDHHLLNEVPDLQGATTTSELLALYFYRWAHARWPEVVACRVAETPTMSVTYWPEEIETVLP